MWPAVTPGLLAHRVLDLAHPNMLLGSQSKQSRNKADINRF